MSALHAAFDLGAGSGRAFIGAVTPDSVHLSEAHRFHYTPRRFDGHLRWDMTRLYEGLLTGLRLSADAARLRGGEIVSVGVDAWGVDYGLLDEEERLIEDPVCYRDGRTAGSIDQAFDRVFSRVPREALFEATGIQFLPFNTIFQLAAHMEQGLSPRATRLLLMPDLCHHYLCGATSGERTNASTTQLVNVTTGEWDDELFDRLNLPRALMPALANAGSDLGLLRPALGPELNLPAVRVIAPATHDTASAVAGTPLEAGYAYISSGTWSLVGVERDTPLSGADVLAANVTNERGVGGTIRFLKNVMGLWILESCRREWDAVSSGDLTALLAGASAIQGIRGLICPDSPRFFNPRSMLAEIGAALRETGQAVTEDPATLTKVILDSLALRYAAVVGLLESLTRAPIAGIHIVGGGALNTYLNQATANASGRLVLAGPVEATAIGNLLVQSVACGTIASVAEGRRAVAAAMPPRRFEPRAGALWQEAAIRYRELETRA